MNRPGFSRADLLAVVTVAAVLIAILFPWSSGRWLSNQRTAQCRENLRRLTVAWSGDAEAHDEWLLLSMPLPANEAGSRRVWVTGTLNAIGAANRENWDAAATVARSPLSAFLPPGLTNHSVWRCPADRSHVVYDGRALPRVRSYSMSSVFDQGYWLPSFRYRTYAKRSHIVRPARTFVLADEHPDGINDAAFAVQMVEPTAAVGNIIDLPGSLHHGGGVFSFADGHVEWHRWQGRTIQQPVTYRGDAFMNIPAKDSLPDAKWLSENSTVRR